MLFSIGCIPSSDRFDAKRHQTRKTELAEEDQEEQHEVEAGVRSEGFVGGPEPTEEGKWDEED